MAINDNFVFSDPALQAQVVNAAQVRAAADAARAQQFAETQRALRADRQLQADREERRAIREADIKRQDTYAAEQRRQFDEDLKFRRDADKTRVDAEAKRISDAEERERYSSALRLIQGATGRNLPTTNELASQIADLSPQHRELVKKARDEKYAELLNDFNLVNAEVERLNPLIGQDDGTNRNRKHTADSLRRSSALASNLLIGPDGRIRGLAIKPREDAVYGPEPEPARTMPGATPAATPGVEKVTDVLARTQPGFLMRGANEVADLDFASRLGSIGRAGANLLGRGVSGIVGAMAGGAPVAPVAPAAPPARSSPGFFVPTGGPPEAIFQAPAGPVFSAPIAPVQLPMEGRIPFAPSPRVEMPSLIPAEQFDVPAGGFTGGERLINRGLRLTESKADAAARRLYEARKTFPRAMLVERPDGIFIDPNAPEDVLAPTRLAPTQMPQFWSPLNPRMMGDEGVLRPLEPLY